MSPKKCRAQKKGVQKGPKTQKGSKTVREEPRKAQKLSGRSPKKLRNWKDLKRLRNCPGAQTSTKLSKRSPKRPRNCPGGFEQGGLRMLNCFEHETVQEEPKKAQNLSGRSTKMLRNCLGRAQKSSETVREEPAGIVREEQGSVLVKFQKTRTHPAPSISVLKNRIFNWDPGRSWGCPHLGCFWLKPVKARFWSKIQKTRTHPEPSISILKNRIFN